MLQDEVANGAAANGADGHSALADRLDVVLHVPPQFQVLLCLASCNFSMNFCDQG